MRKFILIITISFLTISQSVAQKLENLTESSYNLQTTRRGYTAAWIKHPEVTGTDHAVVLFRKTFQLDEVPDEFIIHISADNRYRLFVNGIFASKGPAHSDLHHWYYETLDLTSLLKEGENTLAAEVVNFGPKRTFSRFSANTDFFVQGHGQSEAAVNTIPGNWLTYHNRAVYPNIVEWINKKDVAFGLYVANPTDSIISALYPWGWELPGYDDSHWQEAAWSNNAGGRDTQYAGGINYSGGKLLVHRPIQLLKESVEMFTRIVRRDGIDPGNNFLKGREILQIPPDTEVSLLIDQTYLTIGYPEMTISGGKGSIIRAGYAETLYNPDRKTKGNRNELDNKIFVGIEDVFVADGRLNRLFRPLSHRAFRFIQLKIKTEDAPLTIHRYFNKRVGYPLELKAAFSSDQEKLNNLMEPGWRTASLCAQDILLSDAYYEQMQYVGDCKVHNLAILYLSSNDDLVRNQLMQTDWSRFPDGLTLACYPNAFHLVIPFYSLVWIEMIHDYMMWSGDREFTSQFELGIHNVLEWFHNRVQENGLLGPLEWWNDVDWSPGFPNGVPPGIEDGNSALFTLEYAKALQKASEILLFTGDSTRANQYNERAGRLIKAVNRHCFDESKGLYAETPSFDNYSQHTNILAILTGAVQDMEASQLMTKVLEEESLHQVALFFRYYLLEALYETGKGDEFVPEIQPWFDMMDHGLTTFTEIPVTWEDQRSDCHPWSTSPNIHFFRSVTGIRALEPGFKKFQIKPRFGELNSIKSKLPLKTGDIKVELQRSGESLNGYIDVPPEKEGVFIYQDIRIELSEGVNEINI